MFVIDLTRSAKIDVTIVSSLQSIDKVRSFAKRYQGLEDYGRAGRFDAN
jgi:hypothetical protein